MNLGKENSSVMKQQAADKTSAKIKLACIIFQQVFYDDCDKKLHKNYCQYKALYDCLPCQLLGVNTVNRFTHSSMVNESGISHIC
jgi:hypothetical protein